MRGFTLFETIIYIGLFGLLFTGILTTVYPFISGSERLTRNIATEGEVAFILHKIDYALTESVIEPSATTRISPNAGILNADALAINPSNGGNPLFQFRNIDGELLYQEAGGTEHALNATRVVITDFAVSHPTPATGEPHMIEITFKANGQAVGPVRYTLHF